MATHDADAGTGGLDASIMFETERDENVGDAFNGTFGFTNNYYNIKASAADLLALSTVIAVGNCGGPKIPFRVGRVDATEAGPLGVPKPDQDVDTHIQIFAKAGFNTSDMITMVACGHTLGGVHGKDFPEITFNDTETNFVKFEGNNSFSNFDNTVVTEYLGGNPPNPLVTGKNETNNSDKRVFGADNNATMHSLSDPSVFQSSCQDILARMIDTVPSNVALTEPLDPILIKPYIQTFSLVNATHLTLTGRIRVRTDWDSYTDQSVHLTYNPRTAPAQNATLNTTIPTTRATFQGGTSSGIFGEVFAWHEFSATLPTSSSITGFTVTVTRGSTGESTTYDNAGSTNGYALDDTLLYQSAQSCRDVGTTTITAAVRKDFLARGAKVAVEMVNRVPRQGVYVPALEVEPWGAETVKEVGEWVIVQAKGELTMESLSTTFDVVAGEKRVEFQRTNVLGEECAAL
ncbi:peroxidase [Macrophomina phaseolina MS6]|uniref:Peroxidase n=1 Tax=Macrophomina phaseolina (strain MS6) TaxID=1126212 RepID=K2SBT8_MACPH|nr:peroxidase [Macrophomina phaseolina MS6]